jgi:hypothetical protein
MSPASSRRPHAPRSGRFARASTSWLALIALGACGKAAAPAAQTGSYEAGVSALTDAAVIQTECSDGETESCDCDDAGSSGLRACVGGQYSSCTGCFSNPGQTSKCVAGHYTGRFSMSYTPGPAGICGLTTLFGGSGAGPLAFDVVSNGSDEFYQIGGGCLRGRSDQVDAGIVQIGADIFAKGVEFKAIVSGVVDCATGNLEGELRGTYRSTSFCGVGLVQDDFFFKGPIKATYNPDTKSFEMGTLVLHEPPVAVPLNGQPGGMGTWQVTLGGGDGGVEAGNLYGDAGLSGDGGSFDCLDGVMFKDFNLPGAADAGM